MFLVSSCPPLSRKPHTVAGILDAVIPNVLPLIAVFAIYFYMQKKGPRYNRILLAIIAIVGPPT